MHFRTLRRVRREVRSKRAMAPDLRRDAEIYAGGLAGGVAAFCVAGAFLSVSYYPFLWYFSAMAVALDVGVRQELAANDAALSELPPRVSPAARTVMSPGPGSA